MKVNNIGNNTYLVLLKKGDNLLECLKEFHLKYANNKLCEFRAIGAIDNFELGYAYLEEGVIQYNNVHYDDEYELLSLLGNISLRDGQTAIHAHASLSDKDNKCVGGHLNYATVSIVLECFITVYDKEANRIFDKEVGIAVLDV
ncbi:MAG: PPC domain-containing DNA-binding protein [bacterium]